GELGLVGFPGAPMLPIGEGVFALGAQRFVRPPERDDVVVNFLLAGDLNEEDAAFAPVADRLDPQARAFLVMRFEILIIAEIALALDQADAARIAVDEGPYPPGRRGVQR